MIWEEIRVLIPNFLKLNIFLFKSTAYSKICNIKEKLITSINIRIHQIQDLTPKKRPFYIHNTTERYRACFPPKMFISKTLTVY